MAFKLKTSLVSTTPSVEYFEGESNEVFTYGEALTLTNGKVTKCAGTVKPDFISLGDVVCKEEKTLVPVMRVFDFYIFTCPIVGDSSSVTVGNLLTVNVDATGVTSQTSGGIAEVVSIDGNEACIKF